MPIRAPLQFGCRSYLFMNRSIFPQTKHLEHPIEIGKVTDALATQEENTNHEDGIQPAVRHGQRTRRSTLGSSLAGGA